MKVELLNYGIDEVFSFVKSDLIYCYDLID